MFEVLKKRHVIAACRKVVRDGFPSRRGGRSTFIRFEGELLPAKYVLGLAYEIATGKSLSPNDFHGGDASAVVLELLGFQLAKTPMPIGRIVVKGPAGFNPQKGRRFLTTVFQKHWPQNIEVNFLITPGGFLRTDIDDRWSGNRGWDAKADDILAFVKWAQDSVKQMLTDQVFAAATGKAKFLTVGSDVVLSDDTHAELVFIVDIAKKMIVHWTGKSYPTTSQERSLVQVTDLNTHFVTIAAQRVMILGCHDLNMFSARARASQDPNGARRKRCNSITKLARRFKPTVVLQHPHSTDTPNIWRMPWACLAQDFPSVKMWASGICYHNPESDCRASLDDVLDGTRSAHPSVVEIID